MPWYFDKLMRARQSVAAAPDNDDIVGWLEVRRCGNVAADRIVPAETVFQKPERHLAYHAGRWSIVLITGGS